MPASIRIACFQRREFRAQPEKAAETIIRDVAWADDNGADLCLFPESFLQGYPHSREAAQASALRLTDTPIRALLSQLSASRATVVVGFIEAANKAYYNSALVIREGQCLGVSHKSHPNEDGISPGGKAAVYSVGHTIFGVSICNDANYPETVGALAEQGAQIILAPLNNMLPRPTADAWRIKTARILQQRARETGCWIASADVVGADDSFKSYGCTTIIAPNGEIIEKAPENIPGAIMHTLKL